MLDTILINDEVKEYVESEKEKYAVKTKETTSISTNNVKDTTAPKEIE